MTLNYLSLSLNIGRKHKISNINKNWEHQTEEIQSENKW